MEVVAVGSLRFGEGLHVRLGAGKGLPSSFVWRGQRHVVRSVEARRTTVGPGSELSYFTLRTETGMRCEVSFDPARGTWRLERILTSKGGRNERWHALV